MYHLHAYCTYIRKDDTRKTRLISNNETNNIMTMSVIMSYVYNNVLHVSNNIIMSYI